MKRHWKWLTVFLLLAGGLYLLLGTSVGLQLALALARAYAPGEIQVARLEGRWLGPLEIRGLRYRAGGQDYRIEQFGLDWHPLALLHGRLDIARLQVAGVTAELGPVMAQPEAELRSGTPDFSLPLAIRIRGLDIRDVAIQRRGQPLFQLDDLRLAVSGQTDRLQLGSLELVLPQGRLQASGDIGLREQVPTDLELQWSAALPPLQALAGKARLTGDWRRLQLEYQVEQPAPAQLQLQLQQPFGALRWQAVMDLPQGSLQGISAAWPDLQLAGHVEAQGDLRSAGLQAELHTDAGAATLYPLQLQARLQDQGDGWRLDQARLQQPDSGGELRVAGNGLYGGFSQLTLDWTELRWPPLPAAEPVSSPAGHLEWSGTPRAYQLQLDTRVQGAGLPMATWRLQGHGDTEQLQIDSLRLAALEGEVTGQGEVRWAPELHWQAKLDAQQLNPGVLARDWPGRLAAGVELEGGRREAVLYQQLLLSRLEGTLRGYPVQGQGRLALDGDQVRIAQLELQSGTAQLNMDARLDQHWQGNWQLRVPDLAMLIPEGKGRLQGQGTLSGSRALPRLTARLQGRDLAGGELGLGTVRAELDWDAARDGAWRLELAAQDLYRGTQRLANLSAAVQGTARQHRLTLQADGDGVSLMLGLAGRWQEGQWQGQVTRADWSYPGLGPWTLAQAAALSFGAGGDRLDPLCWQREQSRLCLQGAGDREQGWDTRASLAQLPLPWLALDLPAGHQLEGSLDGRLQLHLQPDGTPAAGEFALDLSPGQLRFGSRVEEQSLSYGGGQLSGRLEQDRLRLHLQLALAGEDRLEGGGTITDLRGADPRLDLRLGGEVRQLALAEAFSDEVEAVQGQLRLDARLAGSLAAPALSGRLDLDQGRVTLPAAGLRLEALQLALQAQDAAHIGITGSARSGEGELRFNGTLEQPDDGDWHLQLQAQGERFLVVDIPEYQVRLSPDLHIDAVPRRVRLEGDIEVPYARLRPRDFSGAVAPSSDVVRVGEEQALALAPPSPWQVYSNIRLRLGEDVQFNGFGLKGFLGGSLTLRDEPERLTTARGVLAVREGRYKAYGQDLNIETGRVLYNDSLLDNPGLDIKAARHVGEITAGVRVGGQLRKPEVSLYSDPALSESDTLSYLLLGRPVQQTSGAEGDMLMRAATAAGLGGGGLLAAQIGERLGLDEVEVGGGDSLEEAALLVGKYLSPRLYVQYSVGLLEPISTFRVRYQMSRRWQLQTETGTESGADVLYTLE